MTAHDALRASPFDALLATQEGVVARRQWLALGQTARSWNWQLTRGRWQQVIPGVAVTHSGCVTDRERAWAAVLHAGREALLSGDAALVVQGFRLGSLGTVDVIVPHPRTVVGGPLRGGPRLVTHTLEVLDPSSTSTLPTASPASAVIRAVQWAPSPRAAEWRLAAVVQQGIVHPCRVRELLAVMTDLEGTAWMLPVLDDVEHGAHAGSELEFLRFCRQHGLPEPDELQVGVRVGGMRYLDARYRRQRVTVELDGAHHREAGVWDADALRSLRVVAALTGERVIRLTMGNLRHDGLEVAALLGELLG